MENKENQSHVFWYVWIGICTILIILVAVGFTLFVNRKPEVIENEENGGKVVLNYASNISGLRLVETAPVSDSVAIKNMTEGQYFDFSVDVTLDNAASIEYEIAAIKDPKNTNISDEDIRIYLEKEDSGSYISLLEPSKFIPLAKESEFGSEKGSMSLATVTRKKKTTDHYRLRIWLSDTSALPAGNFSIDVVVNGIAK